MTSGDLICLFPWIQITPTAFDSCFHHGIIVDEEWRLIQMSCEMFLLIYHLRHWFLWADLFTILPSVWANGRRAIWWSIDGIPKPAREEHVKFDEIAAMLPNCRLCVLVIGFLFKPLPDKSSEDLDIRRELREIDTCCIIGKFGGVCHVAGDSKICTCCALLYCWNKTTSHGF